MIRVITLSAISAMHEPKMSRIPPLARRGKLVCAGELRQPPRASNVRAKMTSLISALSFSR